MKGMNHSPMLGSLEVKVVRTRSVGFELIQGCSFVVTSVVVLVLPCIYIYREDYLYTFNYVPNCTHSQPSDPAHPTPHIVPRVPLQFLKSVFQPSSLSSIFPILNLRRNFLHRSLPLRSPLSLFVVLSLFASPSPALFILSILFASPIEVSIAETLKEQTCGIDLSCVFTSE